MCPTKKAKLFNIGMMSMLGLNFNFQNILVTKCDGPLTFAVSNAHENW